MNGTYDTGVADDACRLGTWKAGEVIKLYVFPVILLAGFVGNTLCILVTRLRHNKAVPFCVYLAALAVTDNVMLLVGTILWVVVDIIGNIEYERVCHLTFWLLQTLSCYSVYLVIFMTLDRCLAVCYPHLATTWRTIKTTWVVIVTLAVIMAVANTPVFISSLTFSNNTFCFCIFRSVRQA